jgi:hypothetical protein
MSDGRALLITDVVIEDENEDEADFHDVRSFEDILREAQALARGDLKGAGKLMIEAAHIGIGAAEADVLVRAIAKAINMSLKVARELWAGVVAEVKRRREEITAAARAEAARREAEALQRRRQEERERLEASCHDIANSKTLLADMTKHVQALGMVGEGPAIRGGYLALSSRLLVRRAICLLRRGAPSGGKNYMFETTLLIIPEEAVVRVSSASPLGLMYYGDEDEDALKHKVVYIPEAAVLVEKSGVESPLAIMLRGLISEGKIDRIVTVTQPNTTPKSVRVRRNGPIAAMLTSARPNVEEELLTRLMGSDADESEQQTLEVIENVFTEEDSTADPAETERWLNFQRLLEFDAPYDVVIPYRRAIWIAFRDHWKERREKGEKFKLRIRRDTHGFLSAIRTSAVLHKEQREKDDRSRIVAMLADYGHAHDAFDTGLAALHQVRTPETLVAVVRAVEAMGATISLGVKVTVRALMDRLGIASFSSALERLRDAEACGLLKLVEQFGGYGATEGRSYMIGKPSEEITREIKRNPFSGLFPTQEQVAEATRNLFSASQSGTKEQEEQVATDDNVQGCSTR